MPELRIRFHEDLGTPNVHVQRRLSKRSPGQLFLEIVPFLLEVENVRHRFRDNLHICESRDKVFVQNRKFAEFIQLIGQLDLS
jgi:hypothetical protein